MKQLELVVTRDTMALTIGYGFPKSGLAEVIVDTIPEPEVEVDWHAIEQGLGIELAVFGDYLELIGARDLILA